MPATCACLRTVSTSQRSVGSIGFSITCAPTMRLADHLDIASETSEPAKPITADNPSTAVKLIPPVSSIQRSTPSRRNVILITNSTATLVKINKKMRFIRLFPPSKIQRNLAQVAIWGVSPFFQARNWIVRSQGSFTTNNPIYPVFLADLIECRVRVLGKRLGLRE